MFSRLYLHIPWCLSKCGYCAFYSQPLQPGALQQTCGLLQREMELFAQSGISNQPLRSIYLGGGTPSLLSPMQLAELLACAQDCFGLAEAVEITLEANPCTLNQDTLAGYYRAGVTRLSLGAQSFRDDLLQTLGRRHTAAQLRDAVVQARRVGFDNLGLDLICGLPGQTTADWQQELTTALGLQPEHLSIYGLTIEEGTPFATRYPDDSEALPGDDQSAAMLEQADLFLTEHGYEHYEIANFARPGRRSDHNCGYWQRDGYLGLGPAAHSFLLRGWGERFSNPPDLERWSRALEAGRLCHEGQHLLEREEALQETIFLGLRMADGIRLNRFAELFGERLEQRFAPHLTHLQQAGLLTCTPEQIALTPQGMLLSNQVFVRFM